MDHSPMRHDDIQPLSALFCAPGGAGGRQVQAGGDGPDVRVEVAPDGEAAGLLSVQVEAQGIVLAFRVDPCGGSLRVRTEGGRGGRGGAITVFVDARAKAHLGVLRLESPGGPEVAFQERAASF